MMFADVIVPVPVDGRFTYSVPPQMERDVAVGKRVVVEFGRRKRYSAVVARLHADAPDGGLELKPIIEVVDDGPVVFPAQIDFWKWVADYYLCSEGEVMTVAMPAGMKLASESVVRVAAAAPGVPLTPMEQAVVSFLSVEGKMSVGKLEAKTGHPNLMATVRSLYDKGVVSVNEVVARRYKARQEARVALSPEFFGEKKIEAAMRTLTPPQQRLLEEYVSQSSAVAAMRLRNRNILRPVSRAALLAAAGCSASPLESLRKKGILQVERVDVSRLKATGAARVAPRPLSPAQRQAHDAILSAFATKGVCLLHGVTSSGKTEIYIHLIARALKAGKSVLYLLPEIALTTQITARLRLFFGDEMGVYHSRFTDGERVEIWRKQMSPRPYRLIVGARSALFLPMSGLGLVIVDEEHEPSYKQEDPAPRYNARDTAIVLAARHGAKTLLGTATPSLESYHNAMTGKYALVRLAERFGDVMLPEIKVEDVRELRRKKMMRSSLSPVLIEEMGKALEAGQQTILFQNRRGYASYIECRECGWVPKCEKCDVSLSYHKASGRLCCHYCGATYPIPPRCPKCGGTHFQTHGVGTERVENEVHTAFPTARTARLDLDTTRGRDAYDRILADFRDGATDILIGTQMVAKGLDFDRVRVVGILDADMAMDMPDFRSHERAFQMMSQVAGRAGRRNSRGIVILQTSQPGSELVAQVVANDYEAMYKAQMDERAAFAFPPCCRLIYVFIRSHWPGRASDAARAMAECLQPRFGGNMLGPANPPVARVRLEYIRQIMLKIPIGTNSLELRRFLRGCAAAVRSQYNVRVYFDVDPL